MAWRYVAADKINRRLSSKRLGGLKMQKAWLRKLFSAQPITAQLKISGSACK